jgi:hypothetical protein
MNKVDERARRLGFVIVYAVQGLMLILGVGAFIMASLYVSLHWLGLSQLRALWLTIGAPVVITFVVTQVLSRRRSRD